MPETSARLIAAAARKPALRDAPHPMTALFAPLDFLLAAGGDPRLQLHPQDRLNGYGCRPFPRPEAFTFASSTATSISVRAYVRAEKARADLIEASISLGLEAAFDRRIEAMRDELKTHLKIEDCGAEIVFSPSGTDSQLHALFVAQSLLGAPLASVIAAADETGSGTIFSVTGRHFNTGTAQGVAVEKGALIDGFAPNTTAVEIRLRDKNGDMRALTEIDAAFLNAVAGAVTGGRNVLLHVMDRSKLGWRSPSPRCLDEIGRRWPGAVQVVVDACQMRLGRKRLKDYLERGFMVLTTGSKFFTGAPFSGALIVPAALSARMAQLRDVPRGLADYSNAGDWPKAWHGIRTRLSPRMNFGQWLRWEAALEEMRAYFAAPLSFRKGALKFFASEAVRAISASPSLLLLPAQQPDPSETIDDEEMGIRTIWPFLVCDNGEPLSAESCKALYRALNRDVSALLPADATPREKYLARELCHIGQPVALTYGGAHCAALRLSAGARIVSETWSDNPDTAYKNLLREVHDFTVVVAKIEMLVRYRDAFGIARATSRQDFYDAARRLPVH